jgi:hypothetical protein
MTLHKYQHHGLRGEGCHKDIAISQIRHIGFTVCCTWVLGHQHSKMKYGHMVTMIQRTRNEQHEGMFNLNKWTMMTDSLVIPSDPFVDLTSTGASVCLQCILTPSYG